MNLPFRPIKRLGQHFLADPNTARRIVGALKASKTDSIVEIGPGTGALTGLLLERFEHVMAVEVDTRAAAYLQKTYPDLIIRDQDVLEWDWMECMSPPLHIIGNLPYNITSPIVMFLFDTREILSEAVLMMQLEVARRLVASPGTKAYGIPSVMAQLYSRPQLLFKVSRNVFIPKPGVESAVVRLDFAEPAASGVHVGMLRGVLRKAFGTRRKMLRNCFEAWTRPAGVALPDEWACARAEELSPADYVQLTQYFLEVLPANIRP